MTAPHRQDETERFTSCGFLYNPKTQSVLLHLRDGNTTFCPNCWAFFGGKNEGPETKEECYKREMEEEINFTPTADNIHFLRHYPYPEAHGDFYIFYSLSEDPIETLTLNEGADFQWIPLDRIPTLALADYARKDLEFFIKNVVQG